MHRQVSFFRSRLGTFRAFKHLGSVSSRNNAVPRAVKMITPGGRQFTTLLSNDSATLPTFHKNHLYKTKGGLSVQKRTMFIQTEVTPNDDALRFIPGVPVLDSGNTMEFMSPREALKSPLAIRLFGIDGIKSVMFGKEFISVVKDSDTPWQLMKPDIYAAIMDHFASGKPILKDPSQQKASSTDIAEGDSDIVAEIKELLETRIRPSIQEDGGDLDFVSFDESAGLVKIRLRGSCRGCSSSTITLKNGIENMLKYYIPEVQTVEDASDELEALAARELEKLEKKLESEQQQ
ncbi:hypothetical protein H4219_000089 [Mycoemilia scoparia]|uniref:Scaffold protein Nfu/NifU N-terminal domain-containing protein n=1 Tax=Mycoemilia scoparia TaxID=417184 RepID=A0A9W8DX22_9FUNG|nr:hypothetical protein H4219_000089 [Mycoemilia scoparia]